ESRQNGKFSSDPNQKALKILDHFVTKNIHQRTAYKQHKEANPHNGQNRYYIIVRILPVNPRLYIKRIHKEDKTDSKSINKSQESGNVSFTVKVFYYRIFQNKILFKNEGANIHIFWQIQANKINHALL
ncbi:MAG: hypothetical protein II076_04140, partial [Bacteroidales bacterium]|nr:hypothetical protein [Bacteroidales bacterium]